MMWLKGVGAAILAALLPIHELMIAVGVLIMADTITGVWAAKVRSEKLSSAGFRRVVSKAVVYQIAVISGFYFGMYLLDGTLIISKTVAAAIGIVELTSILENANTITGKDIFKAVLSKLGSINDRQSTPVQAPKASEPAPSEPDRRIGTTPDGGPE